MRHCFDLHCLGYSTLNWVIRVSARNRCGLQHIAPRRPSPRTVLHAARRFFCSFERPDASLYIFVNAPSMNTSKAVSTPLTCCCMLPGRASSSFPAPEKMVHDFMMAVWEVQWSFEQNFMLNAATCWVDL